MGRLHHKHASLLACTGERITLQTALQQSMLCDQAFQMVFTKSILLVAAQHQQLYAKHIADEYV